MVSTCGHHHRRSPAPTISVRHLHDLHSSLGPRPFGPAARGIWLRVLATIVAEATRDTPATTLSQLRSAYRRWRERRRNLCELGRVPPLRRPGTQNCCWRKSDTRGHLGDWVIHPVASCAPDASPQNLAVGTYNVGGPRIKPARFAAVLSWLAPMGMMLWVLSEFRPTQAVADYVGLARAHGYDLLCSAQPPGGGGGGLGVLVSIVARRGPHHRLDECCRGHLAHIQLDGGPMDHLCLVAAYVPHDDAVRAALVPALNALLAAYPWLALCGDLNAVTHSGDATRPAACPPMVAPARRPWAWLRHQEDTGKLVDVVRAAAEGDAMLPTHTRVRRYAGTTAYIDRIYLSHSLARAWPATHRVTSVLDVTGRPGASDHNPVVCRFVNVATVDNKKE